VEKFADWAAVSQKLSYPVEIWPTSCSFD